MFSASYRVDGSAAAGKVDLLGVLIHELGHVLGLEHSDNGLDSMATTVTPGLRRLLGADELALMSNLQQAVTAKPTASSTAQAEQYQVVINPLFINGNFSADTAGWSSTGQVAIANNAAVLTESTTSQTRLNQAFIVGANDRYLSFTLSGIALDDPLTNAGQVNGPDDAFEVALLNANTGASLLSPLNLTRTDALLNLQANGAELLAKPVGGSAFLPNA